MPALILFTMQKKIIMFLRRWRFAYFRAPCLPYIEWIGKYNLISVEDPLNEKDWIEWRKAFIRLKTAKGDTMVITDDLTVTNIKLLEKAIKECSSNAIIIKLKPNWNAFRDNRSGKNGGAMQAGKSLCRIAQEKPAIVFIADLAVAVGSDFNQSRFAF